MVYKLGYLNKEGNIRPREEGFTIPQLLVLVTFWANHYSYVILVWTQIPEESKSTLQKPWSHIPTYIQLYSESIQLD